MAALTAEYFTDPLSPWCWAAQPVVRRLQFEFPDLELVPRMTLLLPEPDRPDLVFGAESADAVRRQFVTAVRGSGMPVVDELWPGGLPSSRLPCAAVAYVRETAPGRVEAYLHRLREAVYAAGDPVDAVDPLRSLAVGVGGIDGTDLERALGDGRAARSLAADLDRARSVGSELAGSVDARGAVGRLPAAPRLAAVEGFGGDDARHARSSDRLTDGRGEMADGTTAEPSADDRPAPPADDDPEVVVAPPVLRFETPAVVVADLRIGYQRLAAIGGRAIPRQVDRLSDKYGTGRLSMHLPQHLAESLSSRDYVDEVRSYVTRFDRVYVAEVAAGTGRTPETCRDCLETLAAGGTVEPLDPDGAGWRMIEGGR